MKAEVCNLKERLIYVAKDAACGGDGSAARPYADFVSAFEAAKAALRTLAEPENVVISLKSGEYFIPRTLHLTGEDMPLAGSHLTVRGEEGAVLSSLAPLSASDFVPVEGKPNVYEMPLLADDGTARSNRYLYVDGKIAPLAMSGSTRAADPTTCRMRFERDYDASGKCENPIAACKMYLDKKLVMPLVGDKTQGRVAVSAELHTVSEWCYNIIHIDAVDLDDVAVYRVDDPKDAWFIFENEGVVPPEEHVAVYLRPEEYKRFCMPGGFPFRARHYFLQNALAFLNAENECYYDRALGKLYYYTEGDIAAHRYEMASTARLFWLKNVDGVTFEGVTFTGTDDPRLSEFGHMGGQAADESYRKDMLDAAAVYGRHCNNLTFRGCTFRDLACEGVSLRGRVEEFTVTGCTFRRIGATAVRSGSPSGSWGKDIGNLNVTVTNNDFDQTGLIYYCAPTMFFASTKNADICYNTISNCPYSGIAMGWCWNPTSIPRKDRVNLDNIHINDNYIHSFMTEMCDGAAIYVLGSNAPKEDHELFNFTERNCIVYTNRTANGNGNLCCGIYYDGASTNWHGRHNVIVQQSLGADPSDAALEGYAELPLVYRNRLQARREGSYYFYMQGHPSALAYNILAEENYLLNSRGPTPEDDKKATYHGVLNEERFCREKNTIYVHGWDNVPTEAVAVIGTAGCDGRKCDLDELKKNRY